MAAGGWLDAIIPGRGEIVRRVVRRWVYQYAKADAAFQAKFPLSDTSLVKPGVVTGDEVVRRIYQQVRTVVWPGLTSLAAVAKANQLYALPQWGAIDITRGVAADHTLTADETTYAVAGWSVWITVEDFQEWTITP